jgi:hypothetical protein
MSFNSLRDKVPVNAYPKQDEETGGETAETQLEQPPEQGILERVAPETRLGWAGAFVATIITLALGTWSWKFIPPMFKTIEFALFLALLGTNGVNWLLTRQGMLSYWEQFDHVDLYKGDQVTPKVGRIEESDGEDPLFEELVTPGFAGLNPTYQTVDEAFTTEQPLMNKIERREDAQRDEWGPARGRLDHAYLGDGSLDYLGRRYVVHCKDTETAPHSSAYEWYTVPPLKPDMDAARKLRDRDYLLREHVIPTLEEEKTTVRNRLEKVKNASMDEPILAMNEIPDLLESLYPVLAAQDDTQGQALAPEPDVSEDIDDKATDRMEDNDD